MPILPSTVTAMANSSTETQPYSKKNSLCAFFKNKWLALQKANQRRRRGNKVSPLQPPSDTEPAGPQPGPSTDDLQHGLSSFESLAVDDQPDLQPAPSSKKPTNFEANTANPEPTEETQPKSKKNSLCAFFKNRWLAVQKANQRRRRGSKVAPFQPPFDTEPVGPQPGPSNLKSTAVQDQIDLQPALSSFASLAVDVQCGLQLGLSGLESLAVDDQTDLQLGLSGLESLAVDNQTNIESGLSGLVSLAVDDQTDLQLGLSGLESLAVDDQTDLQPGLSGLESLAVDDQTDLQSGLSGLEPLAVDDQTDLQFGLSSFEPLAVDNQTDLHPGPSSNKPANFEANPVNAEPAEEKTTKMKKKRSVFTFFKKKWWAIKPVRKLHKKHSVVNPQPDTRSAAAEPNPHTPEPDPPASDPDPPIPEADPPIPEPDPPIPEPDPPIPEPVVLLDLEDQTDNSSEEDSSEDSQPSSSKFVRATPKHKRIGDKRWLRTTASPGPSILPFFAVYEVGEKLGEGSFGDVFLGIHKLNGQQVAIKFVNKLRTDQYITVPGLYKPLLAEVALNLLLNQQPRSPYIVHMIDWFDEENQYILIMEYSQPSENLLKFITRKIKLSESQARGLLYQVVLGAKHCLDRGVFHRDIKLNNCVINTETEQVKLIDFGCGDVLRNVYVGGFTGGFCPPEYVENLTYRADPTTVWSLGYLMYKMMCGTYPFKSLEDMKNSTLTFPFGISKGFQDLVSRCLISDPAKRTTVDEILKHEWFQQMPGAGVSKNCTNQI